MCKVSTMQSLPDFPEIPADSGLRNPDFEHFGIVKEIEIETVWNSEHLLDWKIGKTEHVKEATCNMLGFGIEQSCRVIIDYDKDHEHFVVRRYPRDYRESGESL